jgi:hypothetical protein
MSARIVGVHGIGNRQPGMTPVQAAAVLANRWTAALHRGLGQDSCRQRSPTTPTTSPKTPPRAPVTPNISPSPNKKSCCAGHSISAPHRRSPKVASPRPPGPPQTGSPAKSGWIARSCGCWSPRSAARCTYTSPTHPPPRRTQPGHQHHRHPPTRSSHCALPGVRRHLRNPLCPHRPADRPADHPRITPRTARHRLSPPRPHPDQRQRPPTTRRAAMDQYRRPRRLHRHPPRPRPLLQRHRHRPHQRARLGYNGRGPPTLAQPVSGLAHEHCGVCITAHRSMTSAGQQERSRDSWWSARPAGLAGLRVGTGKQLRRCAERRGPGRL